MNFFNSAIYLDLISIDFVTPVPCEKERVGGSKLKHSSIGNIELAVKILCVVTSKRYELISSSMLVCYMLLSYFLSPVSVFFKSRLSPKSCVEFLSNIIILALNEKMITRRKKNIFYLPPPVINDAAESKGFQVISYVHDFNYSRSQH